MASFLLERKNDQSVIGLLSKRGSNFCFNLAHLLSLHHQKILIIDCNFDRIVAPQDQPGLWQYLNHTAEDLPIRHEKHYDLLTSGGTTRHGVELLASPVFSKVLAECKNTLRLCLICFAKPLSLPRTRRKFCSSLTLQSSPRTMNRKRLLNPISNGLDKKKIYVLHLLSTR